MKRIAFIQFFFVFVLTSVSVNASHNDSLKQLVRAQDSGATAYHDTVAVNHLNLLARSYFPNYPDSLYLFASRALDKAHAVGFDRGKAEALRFIGVSYHSRGAYDEALDSYQQSAEVARRAGLNTELASALNNIAIIFDLKGDNEGAMESYMQALKINQEGGLISGAGYNYINIGLIHYNKGRILQAIDAQMEALKISEEVNDFNMRALAFNNIAGIKQYLQEYDEALQMHRNAFAIRKEINDMPGMASNLYSIGFIYLNKNFIDSAEYYFNKSFEIASQIGDVRGLDRVLVALGDIAYDEGDLEEAMDYYNEALGSYQKRGEKHGVARMHIKRGGVLHKQGLLNQALREAYTGKQIAEDIDNLSLIRIATSLLVDIYELTGDLSNALNYYKKYNEISDSLNNAEIQRRSARLDAEYEYMKRENELLLLKQEQELLSQNRLNRQISISSVTLLMVGFLLVLLIIARRSRRKLELAFESLNLRNQDIALQKEQLEKQASELAEANQTKNRLFSIISHDMKAPLAYASMAIEMSDRKDEAFLDKNLPLIKNSIDNVYTLMESLLEWSKVQMDSYTLEMQDFDLYIVVAEAVMSISSQANKKSINILADVEKNTLVNNDKNIIGMVLRNLLTNAIKFSSGGGQVRVFAAINGLDYHVCIEDQGMGMGEEEIPAVFQERVVSKPGTEGEKGSGLGLKLSRELLEKTGQKLWIESTQGEGTRVWFSLKKAS